MNSIAYNLILYLIPFLFYIYPWNRFKMIIIGIYFYNINDQFLFWILLLIFILKIEVKYLIPFLLIYPTTASNALTLLVIYAVIFIIDRENLFIYLFLNRIKFVLEILFFLNLFPIYNRDAFYNIYSESAQSDLYVEFFEKNKQKYIKRRYSDGFTVFHVISSFFIFHTGLVQCFKDIINTKDKQNETPFHQIVIFSNKKKKNQF